MRCAWAFPAVLALSFCGGQLDRGQLDGSTSTDQDAEPPDAEAPDAQAALQSPCDLSQPFGPLVRLQGLDSVPSPDQASLSPDELTIYISPPPNYHNGIGGIWTASRTTTDGVFSVPTALSLGCQGCIDEPSISSDGLTLYFVYESDSVQDRLQWATKSATGDAAFAVGVPSSLGPPGTNALVAEPFLSADSQWMYYDGAGADYDTYGIYRNPWMGSKWGPPELVIPGAYIGSPVLSEDDLTLYYSDESDRCNITVCNQSDGPCSVDADCPGHHGIYVVQRASVGDPFGQPVAAAGLQNIPFLSPTWISPDSCRLYVIGAPAVVYAARHGE